MKEANVITQIKEEKDFFQKAKLIKYLQAEKEVSLKHIAYLLDLKPSHLSHILRLLKLPMIVIDGYYSKMVSISHLFTLARLKTESDMLDVYEMIMTKNLTSPQTEEIVRKKLYGIASPKIRLTDAELAAFTKEMSELYPKVKLKLIQTRIMGKMTLELRGDTKETTALLKELMYKLTKMVAVVKRRKETVYTLE